jgi:hypothetical protein
VDRVAVLPDRVAAGPQACKGLRSTAMGAALVTSAQEAKPMIRPGS